VGRTQQQATPRGAGVITIRPAGRADAEAIRSFITGLSSRTQYRRFFASVSPPSSALLRGLAGAGNGADIVVATRRVAGRSGPDRSGPQCGQLDCGEPLIGHAMAADRIASDGMRMVEIGLVVADASQRRGVGSALLRVLLARAFARGARTVVMEVLPGNKDVLAMIARRWPAACYERTADSVVVRARLAPPPAVAHVPGPAAGARIAVIPGVADEARTAVMPVLADEARTAVMPVLADAPLAAVRPVPAPAAVLAGQPS
jgi:ribosomal protein S18 acetylase RimI-like enzyme